MTVVVYANKYYRYISRIVQRWMFFRRHYHHLHWESFRPPEDHLPRLVHHGRRSGLAVLIFYSRPFHLGETRYRVGPFNGRKQIGMLTNHQLWQWLEYVDRSHMAV